MKMVKSKLDKNDRTKWFAHLKPLFNIYGKRKHPLEYKDSYQLVVMVVLSAQTTDALINKLAPELFKTFPSMKHLAAAKAEDLFPFIKSVRGFRKKANWLVKIAQSIGNNKDIPLTIEGLTELPGIGRKSANVIIREAGGMPQGIMVDLHVLRVIERIGITNEEKPDKIEKALMEIIPQKYWHAAGMSFSYLGREICRPTEPKCIKCPVNKSCKFLRQSKQ
jgi:endonuclease-3